MNRPGAGSSFERLDLLTHGAAGRRLSQPTGILTVTSFHLPPSLQCESDEAALKQLHVYYGPEFGDPGYFTGAAFDGWDSKGSHTEDADRFTADDLDLA